MKFWIPVLLAASLILSGCGDSREDYTFSGQNSTVATPPVARDDAYITTLDSPLVVPAVTGVLSNDTPNPIAGKSVTVAFQNPTGGGGQVVSTNNDGSFTYIPAPGFLGPDVFSYELSNGFLTARAMVTIEVTPQGPGIFVDSRTGNDATANAASGSPYATIQAAVTGAGPGADIVILPGRGTYTGTVPLLNGQRLLGTESALSNAQGVVRPTLSGPVILADGNTLDSLRVVRTAGISIDGDGQESGTITHCEVANTINGTGIQIRGVSGTWLIEDTTISEVDGIGLDMDTQGNAEAVIQVHRNVITDCRSFGLGIAGFGQSKIAVQVTDNVLSGNGKGSGPNGGAVGMFCPATGTAEVCLQILGNQNQGLYTFLPSGTSTISVEQFDLVSDLNSGVFLTLNGQVTDVAEGFCGF